MKYKTKLTFRNGKKTNSICMNCSNTKSAHRSSNLENVLIRDLQFYYWIGFILADGHISDNRLIINLSAEDENHLSKLSEYLGVKYKKLNRTDRNHVGLSVKNTKIFKQICLDFDINSNKTENPPNISIFNKFNYNELLAIFVGFVDGDGCIGNLSNRKDFHLRIKCHSAWSDVLNYFNLHLNLRGNCKINNQGYCNFAITNTVVLKELKRRVLVLNLPILERKWNVINFDYVGRNETANIRKNNVTKLISDGFSISKISKILQLNSSTVSLIIKRNNLK